MSQNKPTPIISPIAALLRSRKTIVALATALANVLVLLLPSLEPVRGELVTILTILGSVLIASISHEDAAQKGAATNVTTGSAESVTVNPPPANPPTLPSFDTSGSTTPPLPPLSSPPQSPPVTRTWRG